MFRPFKRRIPGPGGGWSIIDDNLFSHAPLTYREENFADQERLEEGTAGGFSR
jgi:hypothetical protein